MNKSIKYLALAAMAVSANISAHTQQTYLNLRSSNVNLPMENTTFYERTQMKLEGRFGGNLQVTGFYGETHNDFGDYFGINNKSKFTLINGTNAAATTGDFDLRYMIHDQGDALNSDSAVSYDPNSQSYGARFDYYQNMDKLLKGLYLKVNTTVVCVENKMERTVTSEGSETQANINSFFQGKFTGWDANNAQKALTHGLVDGEHSETGLADIDVILGYKFLFKDKYHFGINLAITIPTGNDPDGVQMFEPVYGNHSHFGFGGGLDAHANLWTKDEQNIKLNFMLNYRYLFEASENRPLKLKDYKYPYVMLGHIGDAAGTALTPSSNLLTPMGVDVTPGSQLDGILALAYNNGGFSFDLGYNMYYREDEDVHVKGSIEADKWGVVLREFDVANQIAADKTSFVGGKTISNADIDIDAAATPSQFSNGIYGGLGYHFKKWDYPLLMGIGGKYDWGNENSMPDNWSVWLKLALSF